MKIFYYLKSLFIKQNKSQMDMIIEYLEKGHSLTPNEAKTLFKCKHLSSRISDMKKIGYKIKYTKIKNNKSTITQYSL